MAANTQSKRAADMATAARAIGKRLLQGYLMSSGFNSGRPELLTKWIVQD